MRMRGAVYSLVIVSLALAAEAAEGLKLRMDAITVPPATGPLVFVVAHNTGDTLYQGQVRLAGPEGWRLTPAERPLELASGETQRLAFNVAEGRTAADNRYEFEITAWDGDQQLSRQQEIFVASAPYYRPPIDGETTAWSDAIPIEFQTEGRSTTVSTHWSRRRFSLLVAVEEDRLVPFEPGASASDPPFDAVQFAITPLEMAEEGDEQLAGRYEFLVVADPDGPGRCFHLAAPDTPEAQFLQPSPLAPREVERAQVAVWREEGVTYYACSLPFLPMRDTVRPSEGREFYFSVLVHDPDGTGIRDLGQAAGLWPSDEDRRSWSRWPGSLWPEPGPRANRVRWGFCSSLY